MYSSHSDLITSQGTEFHVASVSGCTNLEYYEIPQGIRTLYEGDFKNCKALSSIRISKDVERIGNKTFEGCNNLKNITFDKFPNLCNAEGLKTLDWWTEHEKKNGRVVYKKCLLNAGNNKGKITVRGHKINKIMENAFQSGKAKKIKLENIKKLENYAMAGSSAEEIVLGKGIKRKSESRCVYIQRQNSQKITLRNKFFSKESDAACTGKDGVQISGLRGVQCGCIALLRKLKYKNIINIKVTHL